MIQRRFSLKMGFRERVFAYYELKNPENVASVDEIVAKYSGREAVSLDKVTMVLDVILVHDVAGIS